MNNNIILGFDSPMFLKCFQIIAPSKLSQRHVMGKQLLVSKFSESRSVWNLQVAITNVASQILIIKPEVLIILFGCRRSGVRWDILSILEMNYRRWIGRDDFICEILPSTTHMESLPWHVARCRPVCRFCRPAEFFSVLSSFSSCPVYFIGIRYLYDYGFLQLEYPLPYIIF